MTRANKFGELKLINLTSISKDDRRVCFPKEGSNERDLLQGDNGKGNAMQWALLLGGVGHGPTSSANVGGSTFNNKMTGWKCGAGKQETRKRVVVFGSQSLRSTSNSFREPILELMVQKVSCMYWLKIEIACPATSITKLE